MVFGSFTPNLFALHFQTFQFVLKRNQSYKKILDDNLRTPSLPEKRGLSPDQTIV